MEDTSIVSGTEKALIRKEERFINLMIRNLHLSLLCSNHISVSQQYWFLSRKSRLNHRLIKEIKKLCRSRRIEVSGISIFVNKRWKECDSFIKHSSPIKIPSLQLNSEPKVPIIPLSAFSPGLSKVLPSVCYLVFIYKWSIRKKDLQTIVSSASNSNEVTFSSCKLDAEGIEFTPKIIYKTSVLRFLECSSISGTSTELNTSLFSSILKAVSLCPLQRSLKTVDLYKSGVSEEFVKEEKKKHGLNNIQIIVGIS
ncbi:unnamed protein product [Moneuplotes crassus]|uniref:Uncharacterized protein n=1 Tax=Euplotes crassus TaxID=5936 RepID=A0AAD2D415_EUPCR|nr:unnamed protein product [Moneuplotes crassus]